MPRVWSLTRVGPEIHRCEACGGAVRIERTASGLTFEAIEWPSPAGEVTDELVAGAIMGLPHVGSPSLKYSTDLSAAWRVVERMEEHGWWVDLRRFAEDAPIAWAATFRNDDGHEIEEPGPTPALAICRAAVRATLG